MSKKVLISVLALLIVILAVAIVSAIQRGRGAQSGGESSEFSVDDTIIVPSEMPEHISLQVPVGFTETSSPRYDKYYIKDDASIIITGEKLVISGIRADEYAEDVQKQYAATADGYQLLSHDTIQVSGVPCELLEFTYTFTEDMQCMTAVIVKQDYVYLITCKSRKSTFTLYRSAFRQAIESIAIADIVTEPDYVYTATASQPPAETGTMPVSDTTVTSAS